MFADVPKEAGKLARYVCVALESICCEFEVKYDSKIPIGETQTLSERYAWKMSRDLLNRISEAYNIEQD